MHHDLYHLFNKKSHNFLYHSHNWVTPDLGGYKKTIETKYYRDIRITVYNRGIWYFQVGSEKIAPCIFNLSLFLHLSNLL